MQGNGQAGYGDLGKAGGNCNIRKGFPKHLEPKLKPERPQSEQSRGRASVLHRGAATVST